MLSVCVGVYQCLFVYVLSKLLMDWRDQICQKRIMSNVSSLCFAVKSKFERICPDPTQYNVA